jgi:hypothetical protein
VAYFTLLSIVNYVLSKSRTIYTYNGKDLKGSGKSLLEVVSQKLPRGTDKTKKIRSQASA